MPYSPLGRGFLTGQIRSRADLDPNDFRNQNPRFSEDNFDQNLRIVDEVRAVAGELDATPGQIALAWLLAQSDHIAPIPGTKRIERLEENAAADGITLSRDQLARLNAIAPAAGDRYADMSNIDRSALNGSPSNRSRLAISATGLRVSLVNWRTGLPSGSRAAIA